MFIYYAFLCVLEHIFMQVYPMDLNVTVATACPQTEPKKKNATMSAKERKVLSVEVLTVSQSSN